MQGLVSGGLDAVITREKFRDLVSLGIKRVALSAIIMRAGGRG